MLQEAVVTNPHHVQHNQADSNDDQIELVVLEGNPRVCRIISKAPSVSDIQEEAEEEEDSKSDQNSDIGNANLYLFLFIYFFIHILRLIKTSR